MVTYCSSSGSHFFLLQVLSPNNGGGRTYLILLEIALIPYLHHERLLASLSFSPTFLLYSTTAVSQVFFGLPIFLVPFTLRSNALLRKLFLPFLNTYPCQRTLLAFASRSIVSIESNIYIGFFVDFLSINFTPHILLT